MNPDLLKATLVTGLLIAGIGNANAESEWKQTLVPLYLWGAGIEGTAQSGPVSTPVSLDFSDALNHLDSAFTIHYEISKNKIGFFGDYFHLALAPKTTLPNGASAGVDLTNNIWELGMIYRPGNARGLDVLYGLRGIDLKLDASAGSAPKKTLEDRDWIDFFVGLRKDFELSKKTSFTARGDIGTGDSEFVWNVNLLLNYRFNKTVSMFGGYRWLDYDYETGSGRDHFSYDVTYQGPAIALRFDW
jgi:predicted porin